MIPFIFTVSENVTITYTYEIQRIIRAAQIAYRVIMGQRWILRVTSGGDGLHSKRSKHYRSAGIDTRTGHTWKKPLMSRYQASRIASLVRLDLGKDYDVLVESKPGHIHYEYDPR